jgi:hypothetical protein
MKIKTILIYAVAALVALAVPAASGAANGAPHAGKWKIQGGGGFTVSGDQKSVSGLHLSKTDCGLNNITVAGKETLHFGAPSWLVGTLDPSRKNPKDISGVVGQKVTIHSGSKTMQGRLSIVFAIGGVARDNSGDLLIKGCDASFYVHP